MRTMVTGGILASGVLGLWMFGSAQNATKRAVPKVEETTRVINSLDGPTLYNTYCAVCHGLDARGDGPMSKMLTKATPDLTRVAEHHGGKFPRMQIENIISGETVVPGGHGSRDMPIWGPIFSQVAWDMDLGRVRVDNVTRYLETLQEK